MSDVLSWRQSLKWSLIRIFGILASKVNGRERGKREHTRLWAIRILKRRSKMMKSIGYESSINNKRVFLVVPAISSSIKRHVKMAKQEGTLFDATGGNKTRSVLIGGIEGKICFVLSALQPKTLDRRLNRKLGKNGHRNTSRHQGPGGDL